MREITFPADQWDNEQDRQSALDQLDKEGWEFVTVQSVPSRHEYVVVFKPKEKQDTPRGNPTNENVTD